MRFPAAVFFCLVCACLAPTPAFSREITVEPAPLAAPPPFLTPVAASNALCAAVNPDGSLLVVGHRAAAGFTGADLAAIADVLPFLTLAMAKMGLAHTFREVSATYLGRSTAERILDGQIRRGEGRAVPAAILLTDLRGFTALADRVDPADMVTWLNEHFEAIGERSTLDIDAVYLHG